MIKNRFKLLINITFILSLLIPVIAILFSPRFFTFLDNIRHSHTASNAEIEALKRETPFWRNAIQVYNTSLYRLGVSGNKNAFVIARDGWVFLGDMHNGNFSQSIHRRLMKEEEASSWIEVLKYQTEYAKNHGIHLFFILAPAKWDIYSDKLPKWAGKSLKKPSSFDLVLNKAKDQPIEIIDLRPALLEARKNADTYSAFNTHWTDYGAWVAWQEIAKHIQQKFPHLKLFGLEHATPVFEKDFGNEFLPMVNLKRKNPWTFAKLRKPFPAYEIISPEGVHTKVPGSTLTDLLDLPRHTFNPSSTSPLRILVLRDSMGNALSPYLQSSFRETFQEGHHIRIAGAPPLNLTTEINQSKPDLIIYVMTERNLSIPLSDINYWRAYHQFQHASLKQEHHWLLNQTHSDIQIKGDINLKTPINMIIPGLNKSTQLAKIMLQSDGDGQLCIRYGDNSYLQTFSKGNNEFYLILPKDLDHKLQLTNMTTDVATKLVSITTRLKI
ncbi:MAG: hypothetical protein AB7F64_00940 [Gammaproteobacteria bacterium]